MTEKLNENAIENQEGSDKDAFEIDGLIVFVDEEKAEITFMWSEEENPQWNLLNDVSEEELLKAIVRRLDQEFGPIDQSEECAE